MTDRFRKLLVIYNAKAGLSSQHVQFVEALEYLARHHYEVTLYPIIPEEGITSEWLMANVGSRFDTAIVCGGDGTLNHMVNGMINSQISYPIGYLPAGSTNDFSKTLYGKGQHSLLEVCRWMVEGRIYQFDVGRFNDSYFNYVAGFGAFPMVSYTTPQDLKNSLGYVAYVLNFLQAIPKGLSYSRHCRIVHDGIQEEGNYMFGLVSNSTQVAGIRSQLLADTSLNDGVFEVSLVKAGLSAIEIAEIIHMMNDENYVTPALTTFTFRHAVFEFDEPVPWTLDGENGGLMQKVEVSVMPKAVSIYISEDNEKLN